MDMAVYEEMNDSGLQHTSDVSFVDGGGLCTLWQLQRIVPPRSGT